MIICETLKDIKPVFKESAFWLKKTNTDLEIKITVKAITVIIAKNY